jgi:hypothetical protein
MEPLVKKCGSSSGEDGYLPEGYGEKALVGYVEKVGYWGG